MDFVNTLVSENTGEQIFCWLCRGSAKLTNQADFDHTWVSACECDGFRKYTHQRCLLAFVINNRYYNAQWEMKCTWCNTPYLITADKPSMWYRIQNFCDNILSGLAPGLIYIGSTAAFCTVAYTYSYVFLSFIGGREEFLELGLGHTLIIGGFSQRSILATSDLILLPFALVYMESYNWEHFVGARIIQRMLRNRSTNLHKLLFWSEVFNQEMRQNHEIGESDSIANIANPNYQSLSLDDITRLDVYPATKQNIAGFIVTGLAMPFLSYGVARVLFPRVGNNLLRTFFGWTCLQAIRGVVRIAYQVHAINVVTSIKIFNRRDPADDRSNS